MEPKLSEHKRKFQLDRIIFFSDAVFAIAITLLVLEVKVPEIPHDEVTNRILTNSLLELIPKFAGVIVSFFIIGLFWTIHHRIFGYVTDYDGKLIRLNLFYLFFIVIMPFTTGFYSEYIFSLENTPFILYCFNIVMIGFINLLILRHITRPEKKLSQGLENKHLRTFYYLRSTMLSGIFVVIALIYIASPRLAIFAPILVPLFMLPLKMYYKKKIEAAEV